LDYLVLPLRIANSLSGSSSTTHSNFHTGGRLLSVNIFDFDITIPS
jgi:hypothetical protein